MDDTDTHTEPLPQIPGLTIVKSGAFQDESGDGFADAGETITYTFEVENIGNVTLTDVDVTDTVGGVTLSGGPIATMAPLISMDANTPRSPSAPNMFRITLRSRGLRLIRSHQSSDAWRRN
ncbi:MAG: DUF11 domain-containing protein [Acidimicrobiales bacterium]